MIYALRLASRSVLMLSLILVAGQAQADFDPETLLLEAQRSFDRQSLQLPFNNIDSDDVADEARDLYVDAQASLDLALDACAGADHDAMVASTLEAYAGFQKVGLLLPFATVREQRRERVVGNYKAALLKLAKVAFAAAPAPDPIPDPDPEPTLYRLTLDAFYVAGTNVQYRSGDARNTWQQSCDQLRQVVSSAFGRDRVETFSCGEPSNQSHWANINYYMYASQPSVTVAYRAFEPAITTSGASLTGENVQYRKDEAYASWTSLCHQALENAAREYGDRFIAATCGVPSNVSQWANIDYYQYSSQVTVYVRPLN